MSINGHDRFQFGLATARSSIIVVALIIIQVAPDIVFDFIVVHFDVIGQFNFPKMSQP